MSNAHVKHDCMLFMSTELHLEPQGCLNILICQIYIVSKIVHSIQAIAVFAIPQSFCAWCQQILLIVGYLQGMSQRLHIHHMGALATVL